MSSVRSISLAVLISATLLGAWISIAHAEDVLWSTTVSKHFWFRDTGGDHSWNPMFKVLSNPNITVKYHVRVVNAGTGEVLASGATVPEGTKIRLEFVPHVIEDIYWFATGHAADSPNGDWMPNATNPPGICNAKDRFYGPYQLGSITFISYVSFSVHPPAKQVSGLSGMNCTSISNDSQECTLTQPGTFNPQFVFNETYGKFWYERSHYTTSNPTVRCDSSSEPLYTSTTPNPPLDIYFGAKLSAMDPGPYTQTVPAQTIPFTISVEDVPEENDPPQTPTLTSSGACVVGQPHTV
ncbi:MAG: hypothetical protein AAB605_02120, partial [Patescibacteria group bacterium]